MNQFTIGQKQISVYPCDEPDRPVIYLNTFAGEGEQVLRLLRDDGCPPFTLVSVSSLDWNHDMSPWEIPPVFKNADPCTGGADDYLRILIERIVPEAEKEIKGTASWRGIAGYSLAGLFALYSLYQTDFFSRAASMSGSLWYPGITEYVSSHTMKSTPDYLYFSLGSKEARTRNPYMKTVQENTEKIEKYYREKGISTVFQLNPGNHYKDAEKRTAAGIRWLMERQEEYNLEKLNKP